MSSHGIAGQLSVEVTGLGGVRERLQAGNFVNSYRVKGYLQSWWDQAYWDSMWLNLNPWKLPPIFPTPGALLGWSSVDESGTAGYHANYNVNICSNSDEPRLRFYNNVLGFTSSDDCKVIAGIYAGFGNSGGGSVDGFSVSDIPARQIGLPYTHPLQVDASATLTITSGSSWVREGASDFDYDIKPGRFDHVYITTGSSKGQYWPRQIYYDGSYWYFQLVMFDGTLFNPTVSESVFAAYGPKRAFFNEVSVIPFSTGAVSFDGSFDPGINRMSYICRIHPFKSGSPSPSDSSQLGSYWFGLRPYHSHDGAGAGTWQYDFGIATDFRMVLSNAHDNCATFNTSGADYSGYAGGVCCGGSFDTVTQHMWYLQNLCYAYNSTNLQGGPLTNPPRPSIGFWNYKSPESLCEVASGAAAGGANASLLSQPIPMVDGNMVSGIDQGSDGTMYIACSRYNAGVGTGKLISIKRDFTTTYWGTGAGMPSDLVSGVAVDRSRARSGTALTTTNGGGACVDASSSMTAYDKGRAIKILAGADMGTYLIATVTDGQNFTVTTLAGEAVTFAGDTGRSWSIGDRVWICFGDYYHVDLTNNGKHYYMESLAPGTFLFLTCAGLTRGRSGMSQNWWSETQKMEVDQYTGCLYWISNELSGALTNSAAAWAVYKLDPSTATLQYRTGTDLQTPGGSPVNTPAATTNMWSMAINPHSAFRELWIGGNYGMIKIPLSNFMTANFSRYQGQDNQYASSYQNPANWPHCSYFSRFYLGDTTKSFFFGPDGRVFGVGVTNYSSRTELLQYSRQADNWYQGHRDQDYLLNFYRGDGYGTRVIADPYGGAMILTPGSYQIVQRFIFLYLPEIQYQWIGGAWVPQEVVLGSLPDATSSPNCSGKSMHTTFQDLVMGVRVKFTPQGGATPANNEFLGTAGIIKPSGAPAVRTDGALSTGSTTFTGSSFTSSDAGRYLRIESGTQQKIYRVNSYTDSGHVVLGDCDGTTWAGSSGNESGLQYTVWDIGTVGSNAGPEVTTCLLADGLGKDNTQDLNNIFYEAYYGPKTLLSESAEGTKFAIPALLGPTGSSGHKFYWQVWNTTSAQYGPGLGSYTGIDGLTAFDPATVETPFDGMIERAPANTQGPTYWFGNLASTVMGQAAILDLGCDVEVGAVIMRGWNTNAQQWDASQSFCFTSTYHGLIGTMFMYPDGAAPATNTTTWRCTGTNNLTYNANNSTISLTSSDFMGSLDGVSGSDGVVTQNGNTLVSSAGRFNQNEEGSILKTTLGTVGADLGYWRITSVSVDGTTVTVSNLDQTAKAWTVTASGISFQVWNGVREEEVIHSPSQASPTVSLCVERLLTPTTAQVRIPPHTSNSGVSWQCTQAIWKKVKRLSVRYDDVPPFTINNGTFITRGSYSGDGQGYSIYMDFSDLNTAHRKGRWWKFMMQPRYNSNGFSPTPHFSSFEVYDTSGNRVGLWNYQRTDTVTSQPNFLSAVVSRVDFIQANNAGGSDFANANGLVNLADDTITLATGGNTIVPFLVRSGANGSFTSGSNAFNGSNFTSSDVGRWLFIRSGTQSGNAYRIFSCVSGSQVTLVNIDGTAMSFGSVESGLNFTVHDGINAGASSYDYISINGMQYDLPILSINNARTTMVLGVRTTKTLSGATWEIRRRAMPVYAAPSADPTLWARLISYGYNRDQMPQQSGDIISDPKGYLLFGQNDCGGYTRTDGNPSAGTNSFSSAGGFYRDDVGRVIQILSPAVNKGPYLISSYTNATTVTVTTMDGLAVSFTAGDTGISFKVWGEKRFKISRYVTLLKA